MQIEFSNSDTTVQLPQSLDSVSLQAPGPLRIEDDGAGVLPAATTLDAGTDLSATDQGNGIVRLDADGGVDVPGSDTQVIFNDGGDLGADAGLTYDGTLTVQGDGTLLDLQDSGGTSGLTYDGQTLTAQAKSGQTDPLLQLNDGTGSSLFEFRRTRGYLEDDWVFDTPSSFIRFKGKRTIYQHTQKVFFRGSTKAGFSIQGDGTGKTLFGPGPSTGYDARLSVRAADGQSYPAFNVIDGSGSRLFNIDTDGQVTVTNDITNTDPGKGVILTSPDGSTTKRVYLDNNGSLQTEPA